MTDRLAEIRRRYADTFHISYPEIGWLISEVERLRRRCEEQDALIAEMTKKKDLEAR